MAAVLTPVELTGTTPVLIASTVASGAPLVAGDVTSTTVQNDGRMFLICSTDATPRTITFTPKFAVDGAITALTGTAVALAASRTYILGPFPVTVWGNTLTFVVSTAAVLVAAVHIP